MPGYTTIDEALSAYNDDLDALGDVRVGTLDYAASRVLRSVDPIAYRCGFHDWADAEGIDTDTLSGDWGVL